MGSKRLIPFILAVLLTAGCSSGDSSGVYSRTEPLMGTFVQVKAAGPDLSRAKFRIAVDGAFELARKLETRFSVFDPSSEVNLLNISGRLRTSPELYDLIKESNDVSRITGGEFDITVSPALKADGFYKEMPAQVRDKMPDSFEGVGWRNIELDAGGGSVTLRNRAWIDLSGIAKGYIVDRMTGYLKEREVTELMINAGGDIYCGSGKNGEKWKVGVRKPASGDIILVLGIEDMAVATSGDYENVVFDRKKGEVISHIIDPSTDEAKAEIPSSVTVIALSCARADALSTGMMAMGRDKALALADSLEDVEIIVVECPEGRHLVSFSGNAERYVVER
ncbi:MAG: FAD:protein FMN transferase [Candidatus Omnitrophota bacterium]|nr:FAD:protein FMN transferase [Candidatus Omnitrophota bacterium]